MKVFAKDNELFFDYEGERSSIFSFSTFGFEYLGGGIRKFKPTGNPEEDYSNLSLAFYNFKHDNVKVEENVEAVLERYKAENDRAEAARAAEVAALRERQAKAAKWKLIKSHGCRGCPKLVQTGDDDYVCKATGELLPIENKPQYYEGVYYLFNYEPFPCDGCAFKYEEANDERRYITEYIPANAKCDNRN